MFLSKLEIGLDVTMHESPMNLHRDATTIFGKRHGFTLAQGLFHFRLFFVPGRKKVVSKVSMSLFYILLLLLIYHFILSAFID